MVGVRNSKLKRVIPLPGSGSRAPRAANAKTLDAVNANTSRLDLIRSVDGSGSAMPAEARGSAEDHVTSVAGRLLSLRHQSEPVDASAAEVLAWWTDLGRSWEEHLATMRKHIDEKVAEHDLASAKRDAHDANAYASYLIDYCYAAVEEAEYAVLDATLAQMEFDELAAQKQPS